MRIHFHPTEGPRVACVLPYEGADHVEAPIPCPHCKASPVALAGVRGTMVEGHDTMTSDAGCTTCRAVLGHLVVTVNAIFGIAEDRAVLEGRRRVY